MNESLPHAVARMRSQGFSDKQIAGQLHQWHGSWTPGQVSAAMVPQGAHVSKGLPTYHGSSMKPYFPHQKPDHYTGGRFPQPVYVQGRGKAGPTGDNASQLNAADLQTAAHEKFVNEGGITGSILRSTLHPFEDLGQGLTGQRHISAGGAVSDVANIASNFVPVGKAAAILGPGLKVAKLLRDAKLPEGALFHGSPEGELKNVDALYHTKAWREGPGFYLTPSKEKAAKYAAGKTAGPARRGAAGRINVATLKRDANVLRLDEQPPEFWHGLAEQIAGDKVDPAVYEQWARDVSPAHAKGASEGVLNRMRLLHYLTGYEDMPKTDAYYAIEDALHDRGVQATLHHEGGVPVYIVKDAAALERHGVLPPERPVVAERPAGPPLPFSPRKPVLPSPLSKATVETTAQARAALSGKAAKDALKTMGPYEKAGAKLDDPYLGMSAEQAYKAESGLRSAERSARFKKASAVLHDKSLDPFDARKAWTEQLKGELPKIRWRGFDTLDRESVTAMAQYALHEAPNFSDLQRQRVVGALENAIKGQAPRPHELREMTLMFGEDVTNGYVQLAKDPLRETIIGVLNVPRALMATLDFSAVLRQALVLGVRHPILAGKNISKMFHGAVSEKFFQQQMAEIASRPNAPLYLEADLPLTGIDSGVHGAEEPYLGATIAEKFTGGKKFSPVRMSDRAYTLYLNGLRADSFDLLIRYATREKKGLLFRGMKPQNIHDPKFLHDLGHFIGNASGRGTFDHKALEAAMPLFNIGLFSPRLIASRLQMLNPLYYPRLSPMVRREALASALATVGAISTVLTLAKMGGAKVNTDWRSSDFGKIKIGNTRIDIAGGFQQYIHLLGEMWTGEKVSTSTGAVTSLGHPKFGQPSRLDTLVSFGRGKLSPVPSMITDFGTGSNQVGVPATPWNEFKGHFLPLIYQDMKDLYDHPIHGMNGVEAAILGYGIETFGTGLQTYTPKAPTGGSGDPFDTGPSSGGDPFDSGSSSGGDPFDTP